MTESAAELRSVVRLDKQPSIRATVTRALRSAIISGEMEPGRVYSAPSLGEQFGVSATPIREAMLDLTREGLVVAMPNRGFLITEVSGQDIDDVTDIRLLLEPPAMERVTALVPKAALPALREQADLIVAYAEARDLVNYLTADSDFHLTIMRYAGNKRLVELVASLRSQTRLFGLAKLAEQGRLSASAMEHHDMLSAIEAEDSVLMRRLVHSHIQHVREDWSGEAPARATDSSSTAADSQ